MFPPSIDLLLFAPRRELTAAADGGNGLYRPGAGGVEP
jgi:hypothetical protein